MTPVTAVLTRSTNVASEHGDDRAIHWRDSLAVGRRVARRREPDGGPVPASAASVASVPVEPVRAGCAAGSILGAAGGSPRSHRPATGSVWRRGASRDHCGVQPCHRTSPRTTPTRARARRSGPARSREPSPRDAGLADKVKAESIGLGAEDSLVGLEVPDTEAARVFSTPPAMARNARAVYTVCDTCGKTFLR